MATTPDSSAPDKAAPGDVAPGIVPGGTTSVSAGADTAPAGVTQITTGRSSLLLAPNPGPMTFEGSSIGFSD